jgi:hypothetical protein
LELKKEFYSKDNILKEFKIDNEIGSQTTGPTYPYLDALVIK